MLSARRSVVGCLGIVVAVAGSVSGQLAIVADGSPSIVPPGMVGVAMVPVYFAATGGTEPYTWSVGSGLPAGLSVSADGILSGTPTTEAGAVAFVVTVTDDEDATADCTFWMAVDPAGEGESGGTVTMPTALNWQPISGAFGMPVWWYEGPVQTTVAGSIYGVPTLGTDGPHPGADGSVGAGAAGMPNSDAAHVYPNYQQMVNACDGVACTLLGAPSYDGCGYAYYTFTVIMRRPGQYSGGPTIYYAFNYVVCHGRNGYVSWAATMNTSGTSSVTPGPGYVSVDGMQHWTRVTMAQGAGYWSMKFPATAALASLLGNSNGLIVWSPVQSPTYLGGTYAKHAGTTVDTRLRTMLGYLQDSLGSQVDMKPYIPRCASQDIEVSGSGGSTPTDHVLDDAAETPAWVDTDGDGVADFADSFPSNSTRGYYPDNQGVWDGLKNKFTKWAWTGAGTDTMNTTTFTGYSLVWKRPVAGGSPVTMFTTVIDTNPASNPVSAAGTALDALRVIVRSLGTAMVAFWTLWGVLITIRQW